MTDKLDKFMGFDRALSVTGDRGAKGKHQTVLQEMEEAMTGAPSRASLAEGAEERDLGASQRRLMITPDEQRILARWINANPAYMGTTGPVKVPKRIRALMNKVIGKVVQVREDWDQLDEEEKDLARAQRRLLITPEEERKLVAWLNKNPGYLGTTGPVKVPEPIRAIMRKLVGKVVQIVPAQQEAWDGATSMAEGGAYGADVGPAVSRSGEGQYQPATDAPIGPYGRKKRRPRRERVQNRPWPDFQGQGMERGEEVYLDDGDEVEEEARAFLEPSVVPSENANAARFVYRNSYVTKPKRKTPMFTNEARAWDGGVVESGGDAAPKPPAKAFLAELGPQLQKADVSSAAMIKAIQASGALPPEGSLDAKAINATKAAEAVLAALGKKGVSLAKSKPAETRRAIEPMIQGWALAGLSGPRG